MLFLILFIILSAVGAFLLAGAIASGWMAVLCGLGLFLGFFAGLLLLFALAIYIPSLFVDLGREQDKQSRYFRFMIRQFLPIACLLGGVRVHVSGVEQVPRDQPFLLVSNHIYDFDPAVLMYALPFANLGFISKKENYSMYLVNKIMHVLQCVPIDRENDRAALKSILRAAAILREGEHSMGVFPEGYESKTGELLPYRNGAFKIAQRAKVPIVVAVLRGTKAMPKNMFRKRTDVDVEILGVVPTEEVVGVLTKDIGDRIHRMMEEALERKGAV